MLKKTAGATRSAGNWLEGARKLDHVGRRLAVACSILMVVSQGLWLLVNYVLGNLLSALFDVNRGLHGITQSVIPTWEQFLNALRWDTVSGGYVLLSLVGIVASYRYASRRKGTDGLGSLFAVPGYIYGFCGLVGGTLSLGLNIFDTATHHAIYAPTAWIVLMYSAGVAGTLYVIGCRFLFRSPAIVRDLWADSHSVRA